MDPNKRPEDMVRITTPELAQAFIDQQVEALRAQIGDGQGAARPVRRRGLDRWLPRCSSSAVGKQLICVHVNHGLHAQGRARAGHRRVPQPDGRQPRLCGRRRPLPRQARRRGRARGRSARSSAPSSSACSRRRRASWTAIDFLAQGTIYPDILESPTGVKAHHNVGGLPEDLQFELVEPVKLLFKDEVRVVRHGAGPARYHGVPPAVPRPRPGRALPGRHHPRPPGSACARPTPFCARSSPQPAWPARCGSTSPWCPTSRVSGRARRQARLRVAGHHPRRQYG